MRGVRDDIIGAAMTAISKAGLSASSVEAYPGMHEISVSAGGMHVADLHVTFRKDRLDAILWSADEHIIGGSSGVDHDRIDDCLWLMADIERALRVLAVHHDIIPAREAPPDFILGVLANDVSRLPLPGEEPHAWAAYGPHAPSIVREARDIVSSGGFDRERSIRFAKILADALPNLDHRRDGIGIVMMAKRCVAAFEGRTVIPIHEYQWQSRAARATFPLHDPELATPDIDADAPAAYPSP